MTNASNATSSLNCNCSSTVAGLVTSYPNLTIDNSDCGCLNATNKSRSFLNCSCCTSEANFYVATPTCATGSTVEKCYCSSYYNSTLKAYQWNCNCTRDDNQVTNNFPYLDNTVCKCNDKYCRCCITAAQYTA